jgi:acetyl-CoA acetyltransferase
MTPVAIVATNALPPDNYWASGLSELALEAAAPIAARTPIDALFCAAPSASLAGRQLDFASIVADRLSLAPKIALSIDAGDASSAAALYGAFTHITSGVVRSALVVAAAKVSDLSEFERYQLLDSVLDQEVEVGAGLSFASQAGLLAGLYERCRPENSELLSEVTLANLTAWAKHAGKAAPSAGELRRDLVTSPPLKRSDFPQLLDGASALLLVAEDATKWQIERAGAGTDMVALWERANPLVFSSVKRALANMGDTRARWLEVDAGASIVQRLAQDAHARAAEINPDRVNIRGGCYGRGRVWGASFLYQLGDILEDKAGASSAVALSVSGLGSRAFAFALTRGRSP